MSESRVLVVGATGQLGGVIARKLIASGTQVRALARNRDLLAHLRPRRRSHPSIFVICRSSPKPAAASSRSSRLPTTTWVGGSPARHALTSLVIRICVRQRATLACAG